MRPGVLHQYLLRQNLFLMLACLCVGMGVYLLSDIFDRLDNFLDAGLGAVAILTYFGVKLPLIISQLLPAVFLLALVIQVALMARGRELIALRAGGVSYTVLMRFFVAYAVVWSLVSLLFSQVLGVEGERKAGEIWAEQVRKRVTAKKVLHNMWLKDGAYVIGMTEAVPSWNVGTGITVYEFNESRTGLTRIITAPEFAADSARGWVLHDAEVLDPLTYTSSRQPELRLDIHQDLQVYAAFDPKTDPATLPLIELGQVISRLEASGSNVEVLRTAWHMQIAYGFSIVVMALLGLAILTWSENIYIGIVAGLAMTFIYYAVFLIGLSTGQKGLFPPMLGAWLGNLLLGALAAGRVVWAYLPEFIGDKAAARLRSGR